jgi:hypothetical protein
MSAILACLGCGLRTSEAETADRVFYRHRCAKCGDALLPEQYGANLLVGARRAGEIAGVHENTIRNWKASGRLPVGWTMPNGQSRFRAADVARAAQFPTYFWTMA